MVMATPYDRGTRPGVNNGVDASVRQSAFRNQPLDDARGNPERSRRVSIHQSSEHLVATDPDDLCAQRSVAVDAAEAIAPLDGHQCSEWRRHFHGGTDARVVSQPSAKTRIVD